MKVTYDPRTDTLSVEAVTREAAGHIEARKVYEAVAAKWGRLGFKGTPPKLWALED